MSEALQTREGYMMLHAYNLEARARRERDEKRRKTRASLDRQGK